MMYFLETVVSAILFALFDLVWIGFVMKGFYTRMLEPVIGAFKLNIIPAAITYIFLGIGVAVFAIPISKSPLTAFLYGALLGFVVYGVYDATNAATIARWPLQFALADIAWGTVATGLVTLLIYVIFPHSRN